MPQRQTKQREVILRVLQTVGRPLTRKEVRDEALHTSPNIGFATVSRAINELLENHELVRLEYPGQPTRYEIPSRKEHPHLLCARCNRVFDLPIRMPTVPLPKVEGYHLTGYEVMFFGYCRNCAKLNEDSL